MHDCNCHKTLNTQKRRHPDNTTVIKSNYKLNGGRDVTRHMPLFAFDTITQMSILEATLLINT